MGIGNLLKYFYLLKHTLLYIYTKNEVIRNKIKSFPRNCFSLLLYIRTQMSEVLKAKMSLKSGALNKTSHVLHAECETNHKQLTDF